MPYDQNFLREIISHYKVFALVLVRVASLLFMMPVFSSRTIPIQLKAAVVLVIALLLTPVAPFSATQLPDNPIGFALLIVAELFTGMTLALLIRFVFAGLQTAGQMVGVQMGLSVANIMDPQSGVQSVIIAQFAYLIALLLFLAANGHLFILRAIYDSFVILPPGRLVLSHSLFSIVMDMGRQMFILSVKLMAPVMAILLFSQVALGILAKTVPQINLLIVSFGLNIALGLFFTGLTLQVFWPVLARYLDKGVRLLPVAMKIMAGQ